MLNIRNPINPAIALEKAKESAAAFNLISIKRAAAMLGVSLRTMRYWQARGRMPERIKHGHRLKYRLSDIQALCSKLDRVS